MWLIKSTCEKPPPNLNSQGLISWSYPYFSEQVRDVPDKLQSHMAKKHYLHATDLIVSAVSLLEGDLAEVDALRDLKSELSAKKEVKSSSGSLVSIF